MIASVRQELIRCPSTSTVQAPQAPRSQPFFVPVRASRSRSASSKVVRGSTNTVCACPLTRSVTGTSSGPTLGTAAVVVGALPMSFLPTACPTAASGAGAFERCLQRLQVVRRVVPHAVDEERWRTVHVAPHTAHEVLAQARGVGLRLHLLSEARDVQAEVLGGLQQVRVIQRLLVLVQVVVHLPELALGGGCLRRL